MDRDGWGRWGGTLPTIVVPSVYTQNSTFYFVLMFRHMSKIKSSYYCSILVTQTGIIFNKQQGTAPCNQKYKTTNSMNLVTLFKNKANKTVYVVLLIGFKAL